MTNTPSKAEIEALVKRHGATSYRNRADTQHPAYGFTEDGLNGLIDEVLAKWGTQPQAGAVPQGWKLVPVNPTPEMWKAAKSVPDPNPPYPPHYGLVWDAMLAASPTPPAEQAAPKAAPGEPSDADIDAFLDSPRGIEWVIADKRERYRLLVRAVLAKWAAPQQEAQEPVAWLNPWRADQVTTDYDAYGEHGIALYTAPQPSPTAQSADSVQKDAARYRWLIDQHWIQTEVDWRLISTHQDSTIRQLDAAIDAAIAAQGGKGCVQSSTSALPRPAAQHGQRNAGGWG